MYSDLRKELYAAECEHVAALNSYSSTEDIDIEINRISLKFCENFTDLAIKSVNSILELVQPIELTAEFLKSTRSLDHSLGNDISENEFYLSRNFVEELLNVDLSRTKWLHLKNIHRENAEGFCVTCEDDNHHIYTQDDPNGILSTDLLVHELGHAADSTVSRSFNNDALIVRHQSLAEAIAYYCQFKYLLKFGNKSQRKGVFGGFHLTYLSIATLRYCLSNDIQLDELDVNVALKDIELKAIIDSYLLEGIDGFSFISDKLMNIKNTHPDLISLIYNEISPRFGIVLAIYLLDKDADFIKGVILENSLQNDIASIVYRLEPNYHEIIGNLQFKLQDFFIGEASNK